MTNGGEGSSGLVMSDENKLIKSKLMKGENNHMFGIQLFGKTNGNYGNRYDKNPLSKPVVQLTLDGKFIKNYHSAVHTKIDGFSKAAVNLCCNKKRSQHRGYLFIFKSDYDLGNIPIYKRGLTSVRKVVGIYDAKRIYKIYNSISAVKIDGFRSSNVQQCCAGYKTLHKGWKWYYLEEIDLELLRYSLASSESY